MRVIGWGALFLSFAATAAFADVETIVVTARPPDPVGNDAFSVARIDATTLQAFDQLDRALEQVPGLSTFRRDSCLSANPTTQGVSLRSIAPSGASRTLVTLDGVPQNDPFGGWVLWCSLPPEDIASAEVVRGAGAGPYGAAALTGTIALDEGGGEGLYAADGGAGGIDYKRVAASGGVNAGPLQIFGSGLEEATAGWIPVAPGQRGAADNDVSLDARNGSLRIAAIPGDGIEVSARASVYDESRHSGLVGARSEASGVTASLTVQRPETQGELGWRLQGWLRDSDLANTSVAVNGASRASTTPANDEYATPTVGWGTNGELRGHWNGIDWATGFDARETSGETREHFNFTAGHFVMNRVAGGQTFVGGVYVEGASRFDGWLVTAGIRGDDWASTSGHLRQSVISSGVVTLDQHFASREGRVFTARGGIRKDFDSFYVRAAGYEGFRPPTLNELYRPFRVGNNFTLANAALTPETLYGGELGVGGTVEALIWNATVFWNKLHDGVTNVTIGHGPGIFPAPAGVIPAGGLLIQRENVGDIDAYGIEADARYTISTDLALNAAFDLVDAHVYGGATAPQLTGKRPLQAPRWTVTAGADAKPLDSISLHADMHFESSRFADDLNTLRLPVATEVDVKAAWSFASSWALYVAADNILNARIATTESADIVPVVNYDFPRILRAGIQFRR
jgi:outer membrane receptor protein involved in Fe transport